MRRFAWLSLLVSAVALAAPPKPVRKPAPRDLDPAQLGDFVDAVLFDKAGDYDRAISEYRRLGNDVPAIVYNIADLFRRAEKWRSAVEHYKKYLELAPGAPDRAAVQKLIDQLSKTPMSVVVDGDDLDGVVFLDGKPVGASPQVLQLTEGDHVIDRIGPSSYLHRRLTAKPMEHAHLSGREETGNVVMSTSIRYGGSWRDGDRLFEMDARFTLPPGRVDTYFFKPGTACSPVSFEVPRDGLVYVFIDGPRELVRGGCTPIKVTAQKIQFPKVKP